MKKRILSIVLSIVMLVSLLPTTALALPALPAHYTHPVCGATHSDIGDHTDTCEAVEWTAWSGGTITYTNNTASVYLSTNVTLESALTVAANQTLHLCLNGKSITKENGAAITVASGATLNICDCSTATRKGYIDSSSNSWIALEEGNSVPDGAVELDLTGGYIQGRISASGPLNMYGGNIVNSNGVGVTASNDSTFNMYGGTIAGHSGDGVQVGDNTTKGTFNMYGGKIYNKNDGINNYNAYGVVTVSDGIVTSTNDRGIYNNGSGTITVSGGAITGANNGIYNFGGTITVSGGTVSSTNGYGIFNNVTLKLSGAPEIEGTTADVYLSKNKIIDITGALSYAPENAISVEMHTSGTFTSGWTSNMGGNAANYGSYFTSANDGYTVQKNSSGELKLAEPPAAETHSHPVCGATHTNIGDHTGECGDITWTAWDGTDMDESEPGIQLNAGNYYLSKDVNVTSVTGAIKPVGNVALCLNGHAIRSESGEAITISNNDECLTLTDCDGEGLVTLPDNNNSRTIWISYGELKQYGGTIQATAAHNQSNAIWNQVYGTFSQYGGTIKSECTAINSLQNSTVNLYGGTIKAAMTDISGTTIAGILASDATVNLYGGTIAAQYGLAALDVDTTVNLYGKMNIDSTAADFFVSDSKLVMSAAIAEPTAPYSVEVYSTDSTTTFTSGWTTKMGENADDYGSYFTSAMDDYTVQPDGSGELKLAEPPAAETHAHDMSVACGGSSVTFEPWDGTGTPSGNVYLTGDVTLADTLTISSGTVNMCLNGHSITNSSAAIEVKSGATLNICDCGSGGTVSATASGSRGIENYGILTVYGGTVSGNTYGIANNYVGNVAVSGGTVSGGTGIENYGTLTVSGGSVKGTHTYGGYGISTYGTFKLSGAPTITGGSNSADVLIHAYQKVITIDGTLTYSTPISVEPNNGYSVFTEGWNDKMPTADHNDYFIPASGSYVFVESSDELKPAYTVTYDANGAASGSVPVDSSSPYFHSNGVTVLGNTDGLAKEGYEFSGWNTKADGTGTHYAPDSTFTIYSNTTLYAVWNLHVHDCTYTVNTENAAQVIESCTCGHKETATLELDTTVSAVYTGSAIKALKVTYSSGWVGDQNAAISYSNNTNAGTASGSVTIGGAKAENTFAITPKEIEIEWGDTTLTYNGNAQTPTAAATGMVNGDTCTLTTEVVETAEGAGVIPGMWTAKVTALSNPNYTLPASGERVMARFEIVNGYQNDAPVVSGVNETIDGKGDGKITGVDAAMEYRAEGESDYTAVSGTEVTGLHDGTYYVRYAAKTYYNPSSDTAVTIGAGRKLTVTVPTNQMGYTLTVDKTAVAYGEAVKVTFVLKDGYSATNEFAVKVNGSAVTLSSGEYTVTSATEDIALTVEGVADITAPAGEVNIQNNKWTSFLSDVTFGLFFNKTQDVTITATDTGSGVKSTEYYLASSKLELEKVQQIADWQNYSGTFQINPNNVYVVYVKITDNAGNVSYLNSDGVVLDQTMPVLVGIENGVTYYGNVTITVSDALAGVKEVKVDGAAVTLSDGKYTIEADNAKHTVLVTDNADNTTTTYTITVYKQYTVTYVANGQTVSEQTVNHGADATAPAIPTKDGYTQTAPYWDKDGKNITTDTEINAVYTINEYTVTYKADGQVVDTQTVEHGKNAAAPAIPTKVGYTQTAPTWDKDGKNITTDTEINAVYTINEYTVTYKADGVVVDTQTVEHGKNATAPAIPTKVGYTQTAPEWDGDGTNITADTVINAVYTINTYTVTYVIDGEVVDTQTVEHGTKIAEPTAPTKDKANFAGWFSDIGCTMVWNFDNDTVTGDLTLYAKWSEVTVFQISGTVKQLTGNSNETTAVRGATVKLMLGDKLIATTTTDGNGNYSFAKQEAGHYNVVVTNGAQTVTVLIELTKDTANEVVLPASVTNSIVDHKPAGNGKNSIAAGTLVGGLEELAAAVREQEEQKITDPNVEIAKVEVTLTVKDTPPVTGTPTAGTEAAKQQAQQKAIQQKAGGKQLVFFDLSVVKTIDNGGTPEAITDTGDTLLEIRIPFDSGNKWGITIYRYHGDKAEVLAAVREGSTTEGFWVGDDGYIHIYTHKFSTYAVGYTVPSYGYFVPITPDTVTSADTFDVGIVVYVTMSMLAATGSAVVIGKKRKEEN